MELSIGNRWRIEQNVIILETSKTNHYIDELDGNTLQDERKSEVLGSQSELKSRKRFAFLLSTDRVRVFESGTKVADLLYQPLLESQGLFNSRVWSGIIFCRLDWIRKRDFARFVWDVLLLRRKTWVRELLVPQRWLNRGSVRGSNRGLFRFTPRT